MKKKSENSRVKQVIVIRRDLKMSVGKSIAQACHASLIAAGQVTVRNPEYFSAWEGSGHTKIVLGVDSLEEMDRLIQSAIMIGLDMGVIHDAGHTEVEPGTLTAVAIGPAPAHLIDRVTGSITLL